MNLFFESQNMSEKKSKTNSRNSATNASCDKIHDCSCCDATTQDCVFDEAPTEETLYDLADLFKVFADTTRVKILFALMGRELCVAHIAEAVNATQSAVSHQLRILKQAHLVKSERSGKNVNYSLADDHVYAVLRQGLSHVCE